MLIAGGNVSLSDDPELNGQGGDTYVHPNGTEIRIHPGECSSRGRRSDRVCCNAISDWSRWLCIIKSSSVASLVTDNCIDIAIRSDVGEHVIVT